MLPFYSSYVLKLNCSFDQKQDENFSINKQNFCSSAELIKSVYHLTKPLMRWSQDYLKKLFKIVRITCQFLFDSLIDYQISELVRYSIKMFISLFTQPLMRRMCIYFTDVYFCFLFFVFFHPSKKYQTTVLGNG